MKASHSAKEVGKDQHIEAKYDHEQVKDKKIQTE